MPSILDSENTLHGYYVMKKEMKKKINLDLPKINLLLRSEKKMDGRSRLTYVIHFDGETIRIASGLTLNKEDWNSKKRDITGGGEDAWRVRMKTRTKMAEFDKYMRNYEAMGGKITRLVIEDFFNDKRYDDFSCYYETVIERRNDLKAPTREKYALCLKVLKDYCKRSKINKVKFVDITPAFLSDFDNYLVYNLDVADATANNYHKCLKYVFNRAIVDGIMTVSPYKGFKPIKTEERVGREPLTLEEVERITLLEIPESERLMIRIRDYFVFLLNTGLRLCELFELSTEKLKSVEVVGENGEKELVTSILVRATKTEKSYWVPLNSRARRILLRYRTNNGLEDGLIFREVKNQVFNRKLKMIAALAGINKDMISHLGRHSFATNLRRNDVSLEDVSELLGHSSTRMTKRYAKVDMGHLSKAVNRL